MPHASSASYLEKLFGLNGKTAVVIGGTGGLGSMICDALAQAGAYVYVVGTNEDKGQQVVDRWHPQATFFRADSTKREELEALVEHLKMHGRACDILINGAGANSAVPFLEIADDDWNRVFNVNVNAVRISCQVLGGYMISAATKGSIINITSMSSLKPLSRVFAYSASKAALLNLTQNLAREWAPAGIRVNALCPGFFLTELNRKVLTPERRERVLGHTPMARFGEPEELVGAVLLMASERAGSFVTGSNIVVDGGFSAMTI